MQFIIKGEIMMNNKIEIVGSIYEVIGNSRGELEYVCEVKSVNDLLQPILFYEPRQIHQFYIPKKDELSIKTLQNLYSYTNNVVPKEIIQKFKQVHNKPVIIENSHNSGDWIGVNIDK